MPTPRSNTPHDTTLSVEQKLAVIRQIHRFGDGSLLSDDILREGNEAPSESKDVCTVSGNVTVAHNGQAVTPGKAFDITQGQTTLMLEQCRYQPYTGDEDERSVLEGAYQVDGQINVHYDIGESVYTRHEAAQSMKVSRIRGGQPQSVGEVNCADHAQGLVKPKPRHSVIKITTTDPGCQWRDDATGQTVVIERSVRRSSDEIDVRDENGRHARPEDGVFFAMEDDTQLRVGDARYTMSGTVVQSSQTPQQNNGVWEVKTAAGNLVGRVFFFGDNGRGLMAEPAGGEAVPMYADEAD